MAKVTSSVCTSISGTCGDKNYRQQKDGTTVMAKLPGPQVFKTEAQKEARDIRVAGFGGSGHVVSALLDILELGFIGRRRGQSPSGAFMSKNAKTLCIASRDEEKKIELAYNYKAMLLSDGKVRVPTVTATLDKETGKILFEQEGVEKKRTNCHPDDQVYGVVLDSVNEIAELVELRPRKDSGSTSYSFAADMVTTGVFVYVFAVSHDSSSASKTLCLVWTPESEEIERQVLELVETKRRKLLAAKEAATRNETERRERIESN